MPRKRKPSEKIGPRPETFENAYEWFISSAPGFYLRQIDYKFCNTVDMRCANTRSKMKIDELQKCWNAQECRNYFYNFERQCQFLLLVQSVHEHLRLRSSKKKIKNNVAFNESSGWDIALANVLATIPMHIFRKHHNSIRLLAFVTVVTSRFNGSPMIVATRKTGIRSQLYLAEVLHGYGLQSAHVYELENNIGHGHGEYNIDIYADFVAHRIRKPIASYLNKYLIPVISCITLEYI